MEQRKCEHCGSVHLEYFSNLDIVSGVACRKIECQECGHYIIENSKDCQVRSGIDMTQSEFAKKIETKRYVI